MIIAVFIDFIRNFHWFYCCLKAWIRVPTLPFFLEQLMRMVADSKALRQWY